MTDPEGAHGAPDPTDEEEPEVEGHFFNMGQGWKVPTPTPTPPHGIEGESIPDKHKDD